MIAQEPISDFARCVRGALYDFLSTRFPAVYFWNDGKRSRYSIKIPDSAPLIMKICREDLLTESGEIDHVAVRKFADAAEDFLRKTR